MTTYPDISTAVINCDLVVTLLGGIVIMCDVCVARCISSPSVQGS
jgi:hypothetical protein